MPSAAAEPPLSVLSNGANSSFDIHPRKSHDKTISGLFTYTNGTDVETGLPEHRIDQIKNLRSNSHNSLTNGIPNGNVKVPQDWSHSKAGSIQSVASATGKNTENLARSLPSSDCLSKLSNVKNASDEDPQSAAADPHSGWASELGKLTSPPPDHDPSHTVMIRSSIPDAGQSDGTTVAPLTTTARAPLAALTRFSSPPGMSPGSSAPDRHSELSGSAESPRLSHRYTLQVPKTTVGTARSSREFSFSAGPSEEAVYSTGRFSPTRDHDGTAPRLRRASLGLVRRTTRSMQSDAHLDEVLPDEDAARWTELIKQKRASRRRRKEEEDDERVIVGKKVEEGHVNWVTAYNMLTGIRFTVSRTNAKLDRELTDADFDAKHKFSFDVTGNELTPSAKYDFKFKDYSPWVFRHLRAIFGLDPADYLVSLTSKYILSELGSPGKSGSFFYFSRDYKYIIKTIHHAEHKLLRKILRDYYRHVLDNPNTLISQFYGLHRVKIPYGRKIHFVVMNNLFPPHRDIHHMFDLKGSTVGRDYKEEDLVHNPRATLKDLNWLRRDLHLEFDNHIKRLFLDQLKRDVALLQRLHIMDYSLLVGMHDLEKGNEENLRDKTLQVFQPGGEREEDDIGTAMLIRTPSRLENARKARELRQTLKKERPVPMGLVNAKMPDEMDSGDERRDRIFYSYDGGIRATHEDGRPGETIYYLGIIDCLTHYGFIKRIEHFWKGLSAPSTQISPIPPHPYGERFITFITGITMTKEEAERRETQDSTRPSRQARPESRSQAYDLEQHPGTDRHGADDRDLIVPSPPRTPITEKATWRAQKHTDKSGTTEKGRRKSEEEKLDWALRATEEPKPSAALLPVVQEDGENGEPSEKHNEDREAVEPELSDAQHPAPAVTAHGGGRRQVSPSTAGVDRADPTLLTDTDAVDHDRSVDANEETALEDRSGNRISRPPRLNSDLIPHLSPFFASPDPLDPEKVVER